MAETTAPAFSGRTLRLIAASRLRRPREKCSGCWTYRDRSSALSTHPHGGTRPGSAAAVETHASDILVVPGVVLAHQLQRLAVVQADSDTVEHRAAEFITWNTRHNRIKAHHREHHEGRHPAAVLVSRYAHDRVGKPGLEQLAHTLLRLPRRAEVIVDVRDGHAGLIPHRELANHAGRVHEHGVEFKPGAANVLTEELIQLGLGGASPAHQLEQPVVVVLDRKSTRLNSSHLGISYAV